MKNRMMCVIVLVASMTGCAAAADAGNGEEPRDPEIANVDNTAVVETAASKARLADAGVGIAPKTPATIDAGNDSGSTADSGGVADSGSSSADTGGGCPSSLPTAGDSCSGTGEDFCGYGGACGMAVASCVAGVWQISGSWSC